MKRFTDRYINQITGLFVLLALLILGAGIYSAGRAHHWFQRTIDMSLLLPEEGCFGLKPGAGVTIMGAKAGEVTDIEIRSDNRMVARLVVREDFAHFVGTESRVTIKKTLGMAGDAFVEIGGQRGRPLSTDTLIATTMDRDMSEMLQETVDQIRTEVLPAIRAIRSAADRHVQLTNGLEKPALKALDTLHSVTTKIDKGDGLANRLLADKKMAGDVSEVIQQAGTMLKETGAAAKEL
ncbi:MlaD family protein [Planctomycetota bacterium]